MKLQKTTFIHVRPTKKFSAQVFFKFLSTHPLESAIFLEQALAINRRKVRGKLENRNGGVTRNWKIVPCFVNPTISCTNREADR